MAYVFLAIGIVSEIFGTAMLKASNGFTKLFPVIGSILGYGLALFFLSLSFKSIPLSVAYATWCGVGIAGASLVSYFIWNEKISPIGLVGIGFIVIGIVLVNVTTPSEQTKKLIKQVESSQTNSL
ncbi:multidrug efflux SMR transporter [Alkalihalobacillus sp. MEB130]|uniref:DMT family transporter n=1 Tax=Alkalihalobacillus sp. MEB130 TaxID=2976704 RepID=UPI0028DE6EAA|nr:multidrug efflux SMR transporter [Alkalihalobacillus sp. MEB130]MDT8858705.1 multidrug efflux SMR transporter [Alkalihalobacillus sp. MEB130]